MPKPALSVRARPLVVVLPALIALLPCVPVSWAEVVLPNPEGVPAFSPKPRNGSRWTPVDTTLEWQCGSGGTGRSAVFVGSSEAEVETATTASPAFRGYTNSGSYVETWGPNTTYYWRIDCEYDGGFVRGPVWRFTTAPAPSPPTAPSPADGALRVVTSPTLSWGAALNTERYDVYLGTNRNAVIAANRLSPEFRGSSPSTAFPVSGLPHRTAHFWRIDAIGPGGVTAGPVWAFMTRPPPLLEPILFPEHEVTDAASGHTIGNAPNPECSIMLRGGNGMFFIYRTAGTPRVFVRRFDLTTQAFGAPIQVDHLTDPATNGYHSEPTILADTAGRLHTLVQYAPMVGSCTGSFGIAPRWRVLPDLFEASTWSAPACLTSRVRNTQGAQFYDVMTVTDNRAGLTHAVGQSYGLAGLDGRPNYGFPRTYYRFRSNGQAEGPYVIVESTTGWIPELPAGANAAIQTKGDLALGRETSGVRSLHLVWNIRAQWSDSSVQRQANVDLYYARSVDAGETWRPADGSASIPLTQHVQLNDSRFRAVAGDVGQNSERAIDVDSQSRPVLAYLRHRPGTGVLVGNRVDVLASPPPAYDLAWRRWTGAGWVGGTIDSRFDWVNSRPKLRVDADDNIWVFVDAPPRYFVSRNGGASWSGPVTVSAYGRATRLFSYADPVDSNFHYLAYNDRGDNRLYFRRMQLTLP